MRCLRVVIALIVSLLSTLSWADQAAEDPAAQFERGQQLFLDRQYAEALPLFRAAHAASGSPNARLYVARCLYELGELVEAHREMQRTLEEARGDEKYAATSEAAAKELGEIASNLGQLTVRITGMRDDQVVALDGRRLDPTQLAQPIAVAPGPHRIVARAPGVSDVTRDVDVAAGESIVVPLAFEEQPIGYPEPVLPRDEGFWNPLNVAGVATAGVGVVGMVMFGVFGARVLSIQSQLDDECAGRCTAPEHDEVIDDGRTAQLIANVSAGIGAAALVTGGALILFGSIDRGSESAVTVTPTVGGAVIHGRF